MVVIGSVLFPTASQAADDKSAELQKIKHRVTGLFSPDREDDLRTAVALLPNVQLIGIDFAFAEATFAYDPAKLFGKAKPDEIVRRFDEMLRSVSSATFGVKPLSTTPRDKLKSIEIPVVGLDCKGCAWQLTSRSATSMAWSRQR